MNNLSDEHLDTVIDSMASDDFDSHALIKAIMRKFPREYADDLAAVASEDPIRQFHANLAKNRFARHPRLEPTKKERSENVRGEVTENQGWRRRPA